MQSSGLSAAEEDASLSKDTALDVKNTLAE